MLHPLYIIDRTTCSFQRKHDLRESTSDMVIFDYTIRFDYFMVLTPNSEG